MSDHRKKCSLKWNIFYESTESFSKTRLNDLFENLEWQANEDDYQFCVAYTFKIQIDFDMTSACNSADGNDNVENAIAGKHHYKS